jgi:hypothetical protein
VSSFFWQAARVRARPATTAAEVMIRSFMERLPWRAYGGDPPDNERLLHGFVNSRNRDRASDAIFRSCRCGFQAPSPLARPLWTADRARRLAVLGHLIGAGLRGTGT